MRCSLSVLLVAGVAVWASTSCTLFRELGHELRFMEETSILSGRITNAGDFKNAYVAVIDWDAEEETVSAADFSKLGKNGIFGFFVEREKDQVIAAFGDTDGDLRYSPGDPAWFHAGSDGELAAVEFDDDHTARVVGTLSRENKIPDQLLLKAREFLGDRTAAEAARGWEIPVALGEIADEEDPRFGAERGAAGLWKPASFVMESGLGIYFVEKYDPARTPVLFIYGAAGSPHDWATFFDEMDRSRFQPWFYYYPSGRRLDEMATALHRGIEVLQEEYEFERLHVVAHSMGGLVARGFIIKNVLEQDNDYVERFVSISTPWAGHEAAALGVKRAPNVVPSWRDMAKGSEYQEQIFGRSIRYQVDHLLLYGRKSSRSVILPRPNDGTVSVASQTAEAAVEDAAKVIAYDEDHVTILSNREVIQMVDHFLKGDLE